ncbi:MAG: hypothetical protein JZU65_24365 [Chlorobium sp.]|jgi:hypothetical protein|nr:hypothetical protein [Chlorobium sp.]
MIPRLGVKYNLQIKTISKTRDAYRAAEYQQTDQPIAPAVMLDDELIVQGRPINEETLELAIRSHSTNE